MNSKHLEEFSFLIDANLPKQFSFFNNENFTHVQDINPRMSDSDIWNYAIQNNKVIMTKDADFYERSISSEVKPKVIYFQLGNMTLSELHNFFEVNWEIITDYLKETSLVIVRRENIVIVV